MIFVFVLVMGLFIFSVISVVSLVLWCRSILFMCLIVVVWVVNGVFVYVFWVVVVVLRVCLMCCCGLVLKVVMICLVVGFRV